MAGPAEQAPVALTGAAVALFISGTEMPMSKTEVTKSAKNTEVTGSTSGAVVGGVFQIWSEFAPGPSGGQFRSEGHWRVTSPITPPMLRQGAIYPVLAYVRRPGFNNAIDPGSAYSLSIIVDENSVTLDPNTGDIAWRLTAKATGPIQDPA